MHIVIYTTNSNKQELNSMSVTCLPSCREQLGILLRTFADDKITIVLEKPGLFLLDTDFFKNQAGFLSVNPRLEYVFIDPEKDSVQEISDVISGLSPDIAISMTYWVAPFDWLSIKDSLIGENLSQKGIRAVYHPSESSLICFDKAKTRDFLLNNHFNIAKSVYIHHELFYAERNRLEIKNNVYKEYVFEKIKTLKLPVVVKDTTGLSSYGMDVCSTYAEVKHVLLSKKNNGDRLVEEFLKGSSFGVEIYGHQGNYAVSPVLVNSVNQFGLTSPKQNVKLGPVNHPKYNLESLKKELIRLVEALKLNGIAQVDLLFSDNKWYIIEINSRLSGMSQTIAAGCGLTVHELLVKSALSPLELQPVLDNSGFIMNIKFPLLTQEELIKLNSLNFVYYVNQIQNLNAKQIRELGYTEVIFGGTKTVAELMEQLEILRNTFGPKMELVFYNNAKKLVKEL